MWLHAGTDLYKTPVYLRQKLLYADTIITCCRFNRTFMQEHFSDIFPKVSSKIDVCYHGLDLADFPYEPDDRPPRKVIAVGTFSKEKGFDYLIRAARELTRRGVDLEVELVGDGEEAGSLKRLAREIGITDRVRFKGWVHSSAVRTAMRDATILVHPSNGLGDGLPNVIREAMALGTPVIASNTAGITELLPSCAIDCGIDPPGFEKIKYRARVRLPVAPA